jgi:hypothetical protein
MVPPPRSFAADAHECIMVVGLLDPTEYKVVAREFRVPWHKSSTRINGFGGNPPLAGGLEVLRVKARAYARPLRGCRP